MWWSLFVGCSSPQAPDAVAPTPVPPVAAVLDPDQPTADQVLERFITGSHQWTLLTADNYLFKCESATTDGNEIGFLDQVMQQGRQGLSFTRVHERTQPTWGFTAIGLTGAGTYWSATNSGVVHSITDPAVTTSMMANLDPAPACAYAARWNDRVNLGSDTYEGKDSWHLRLTWADDTSTEAWFAKDDGMLIGMLTASEGFEQRRGMRDYAEHDGVFWPTNEKSRTVRGEEVLTVATRLTALDVGRAKFTDLEPKHIEALLAKKVADGVLTAPQDPKDAPKE